MSGDLFSVAPTPPARAPQQRRHEPFTHPCEAPGCTAWGAFGFGLPVERAHWFCTSHRALGEAPEPRSAS